MSKRRIINICLFIFIIIELIFTFNFKVVIGSGMSMIPTIDEHQILLCQYSNDYSVNDIVLYKVDGLSVVHRIVQVTEYRLDNGTVVKTYRTKGDNNKSDDMFELYEENIVCKVVGI